jgi:hypothetical protein
MQIFLSLSSFSHSALDLTETPLQRFPIAAFATGSGEFLRELFQVRAN